jgi:hypothetical protein
LTVCSLFASIFRLIRVVLQKSTLQCPPQRSPIRAKSEMPTLTPQEMKKALVQAGFLIFRTQGDDVILAERVRENLIMDSGVRLRAGSPLVVRVVLRAQRGDFPSEDEGRLFERVGRLAAPAEAHGFAEVERHVAPVADPGDPLRTLDTFYEITLAKEAEGIESALDGVRVAMGLEKLVSVKSA